VKPDFIFKSFVRGLAYRVAFSLPVGWAIVILVLALVLSAMFGGS